MPNWCMNNLTISHADLAKVQEFADAYNSGETCQRFIPRPESVNNKDAFAEDGWYTWNVNHWGTKWDFGKDKLDDPLVVQDGLASISFDTAWSPPIQFYDRLVELGYNVVLWPQTIVEKDINEMVMAGHNVKKIIKDNTFTGLTAKMKFIGWKRC